MTIAFKTEHPLKDYDAVSLAEILRVHFIEHYPLKDVQRLNDAIQVASYLHRDDVRRGARRAHTNPPYIEHPLRVAIRLFKYFDVKSPDLIIAAILHDTVEDHPFDFADFQGVLSTPNRSQEDVARARAYQFISDRFGYPVTVAVEKVSNPVAAYASKAEKIAAYQEHFKWVILPSPGASLLKFSDFVDNAGSLHHHYEYGDHQATYFVQRYAPLIPLYEKAFRGNEKVLARLDQVRDQFAKFGA